MTSRVEIANLALQRLGANSISDFAEDNEDARNMNRAYDSSLKAELRAHPWKCATKRAVLAAEATAPVFGFLYSFPLPTDCLRPLFDEETTEKFAVEGRKILTNTPGPYYLRYTGEITDPNIMDALLVQAFVLRLAHTACEKITQSTTKQQKIAQDYKDALTEARRLDALESLPTQFPEDTWLLARY